MSSTAFFPEIAEKDKLIFHQAYYLYYNDQCELASWTVYRLTKTMVLNATHKRKDAFVADNTHGIASALPGDYYKSGYHRGHLVPAKDMAWSEAAMAETFFMVMMILVKEQFEVKSA